MNTTTTPTTSNSGQAVENHPIRGAIWGLLLGLGVAIYLVLFAVVPFGDWAILGAVVLLGIGLGVLWAYLAPAKKAKSRPSTGATAADATTAADDDTPTGQLETPDDWIMDADADPGDLDRLGEPDRADTRDDLPPPPPTPPDTGESAGPPEERP